MAELERWYEDLISQQKGEKKKFSISKVRANLKVSLASDRTAVFSSLLANYRKPSRRGYAPHVENQW